MDVKSKKPFYKTSFNFVSMKKWHYVFLQYYASDIPGVAKLIRIETREAVETVQVNLLCFCDEQEIIKTIKSKKIKHWIVSDKLDHQVGRCSDVFCYIKKWGLEQNRYYFNFSPDRGVFIFKGNQKGDFESIYEDIMDKCRKLQDITEPTRESLTIKDIMVETLNKHESSKIL